MAYLRAMLPLLFVVIIAWLMHVVVGPFAGDYPKRIMLEMGVAIIMAVSLNIVNGYTGQFSIGHAAFMAIGGYVGGFVTYYLSLKIWGDYQLRAGIFGLQEWLLVGACIIGGLAAAGAGWVVGLPSLRLRGDYLAIVTLGFGEITRVLFQQTNRQIFSADELKAASMSNLLFPPAVGGAQGFTDIPKLTNLFWMYLFAGLTVLFALRLKQSSYGRALLSIREDEIAAEAMGVNVTKLKVRAFVFAAFFAGIAGSLYAHQFGNVLRPIDAGFQRSFDVIIMVVLGGLGSISGSILAAILVVGVQVALLQLQQYDLLKFRMPLFALLLILTMIFRPQGLFGVHEIWDFFPKTEAAMSLLDIDGISISFGGLKAVQNFSMHIPAGGLYGLIGPNGAGKTTVFNLLTGVYRPGSGKISLDGQRIEGRKPYQIANAGLSRTFQNVRLFGALSVLDNVRLGNHLRGRHSLHATLLRSASFQRQEQAVLDRSRELLCVFKIGAREDECARNLCYGDQRRLEIARALATQPKVLLLDEPAAGMNPQEKAELMQLIQFIRERFKVGILLIEHDMKLVMNVCQRITVLDHGETIAEGTPAEIQANPKVIEAYLGEPV